MGNFLRRLAVTALAFAVLLVMAVPLQAKATAKVGLNKKSATLYVGQNITLKLKGTSSADQKWSTSKKSVAEVDSKGKVTAKKKGSAKITVSVDGKKYQCKVKVKNPGLNQSDITLEPGDTFKLKLFGAKAKSWKSSNKDVVVVNKTGKVKAKEEGMARVYCRANDGKTYACYVDVYEEDFDDDDDDDESDESSDNDDDDDEEDEHEHVWNDVVTEEATCTENGLMTKTCLVCGTVTTEVIPALGHDEVYAEWEVTEEPTCIVDGVESLICQRVVDDDICGEVIDTRPIPMTEHEYELDSDSEVQATCTFGGYELYVCKNCGDYYEEETDPLGHDEENAEWEVTKEATETSEGVESLICPVCQEAIDTRPIPKKEQGGSETPDIPDIPVEGNVISESAKELLDQIYSICMDKNFEELCRLDYSSMDDVMDEEGENKIQCYDTAGNVVDGYFYDGKDTKLKQNYTGIGIGLRGQEIAFGSFVRGKAKSDLVTLTITVVDDFLMDASGTEFKNPEIKVSEMYVINGAVSGDVTNSFYSINGQNVPQLNEKYEGGISLVHRRYTDNSFWEKFFFNGEVTYTSYDEDGREDEHFSFFLKDGLLDKDLNGQEDGEWLDTDGNSCDMLEMFENDYEDDVSIFADVDYFDKSKFEIVYVD